MESSFGGLESLVEVNILQDENFLKIKETLTRIGIASKKDKTLYQTAHILHKRGRYYIVHFKEMFGLDGQSITFDYDDLARRNTIANLLEEWGLLSIIDKQKTGAPVCSLATIKVLNFAEKTEWNLQPKYNIGRK
jgi:hypothetical protein